MKIEDVVVDAYICPECGTHGSRLNTLGYVESSVCDVKGCPLPVWAKCKPFKWVYQPVVSGGPGRPHDARER